MASMEGESTVEVWGQSLEVKPLVTGSGEAPEAGGILISDTKNNAP